MAKRKRSAKRPQAKHKKQTPSQHHKCQRLKRTNPLRSRTTEAITPLCGYLHTAVAALQSVLDRRIAFRLSIIVAGMLLADDRRTASAWFAAAGVQQDWDRFYECLISVGRSSGSLASAMVGLLVQKFAPGVGDRIQLALDDSPTSRFGRCVEGAGVHHNPTPGPADGEWLYGHNWVLLTWLATHPLWGVIALPLQSLLYVRQADVPKLAVKYAWEFRTKHELGVALLTSFVQSLRARGVRNSVWLAVDGAYAARPFLLPVLKLGVTVVSRLRRDACLFDLPGEAVPHRRGRHRIYGRNKLSLATLADQSQGWESLTYSGRGVEVTRPCKSFLATSELISGRIRVVLLRFDDGNWAPYFCTDPSADVREILEAVAARWAIEECFQGMKEVWGAGQQQVRNVWSSIGCWNLNSWVYGLVELCSWESPQAELSDRRSRPWDNASRWPSHADRRRTIARKMLEKQFIATLPPTPNSPQIRTLLEGLIAIVI
ncbi:IS701 family transposase [Lignipirellula cremea]|uniref:Transposase IS701-like DDE domain-containing protein n=1 Tax=Lignipirellula cremea TaxID=2528010 RepID=A0A518E577_9BACT|nr:transposase [Lignipirellula cremea]QDU99255.1 hypothetical protein Pla8534_71680 [Lignipirellula cremea]